MVKSNSYKYSTHLNKGAVMDSENKSSIKAELLIQIPKETSTIIPPIVHPPRGKSLRPFKSITPLRSLNRSMFKTDIKINKQK